MKKLLFIIFINIFCFLPLIVKGQNILSPQAKISLLTCSPGSEIYSLFGHSAIRVKDPIRNFDFVYNYGIFDFDTPNFTIKFVRGKLLYKLGVEQFRRFEYVYGIENRWVQEQVFNFNEEEKNKVFKFLINNAKPENAEYKYDFFFDNCSSRIGDVLELVLGKDLTFEIPKDKKYNTYREQLDYYLDGSYPCSPWTDFGMDLILGIPADQIADFDGETFLPDHISNNFTFGRLRNAVNLVQPKRIIIPQKTPPSLVGVYITPLLLFWVLCGLTALSLLIQNNTFTRILDFILFLILGLAGCLFLFMWIGTDHQACYQNLNMLWMFPLHVFLAINILRKNLTPFWKKYLKVTVVLNLILILTWKILPQDFHAASFPIILMISLRATALLRE